jgi:hypothetical protein
METGGCCSRSAAAQVAESEMNQAIKDMLSEYQCVTDKDYHNALKQILQQVALLGLWRGKFFERAAFYGGTALRLLYGLDRFSEDLDFSLLKPDKNFRLDAYHGAVELELNSYGFRAKVEPVEKEDKSQVDSAFIKAGTRIELLQIEAPKNLIERTQKCSLLKIKFELDTNPPLDFKTESKLILMPTQFYVNSFVKEDLFAGKVHALLFRKWKNRVKGRDWYDFVWYVSRGIPLHVGHLTKRIIQSEKLHPSTTFDLNQIKTMLMEKIDVLDISLAKSDVSVFLKKPESLDAWSPEFFKEIISRIQAG